LQRRLNEHQHGRSVYTSQLLPVELVYSEYYEKYVTAAKREKELKGWIREKKEALIYDLKNKLPELSECKNETNYKNKSIKRFST
jgi:putative endonuclease